jgi:hypothetical protein
MSYAGFWEWRADGLRRSWGDPGRPGLLMSLWGIRHWRAFYRGCRACWRFWFQGPDWERLFREEWMVYGIVRGWA